MCHLAGVDSHINGNLLKSDRQLPEDADQSDTHAQIYFRFII